VITYNYSLPAAASINSLKSMGKEASFTLRLPVEILSYFAYMRVFDC